MVTGDRTGVDVDNEEGSVRSVGNSKLCVTPTKMSLTRLGGGVQNSCRRVCGVYKLHAV